MAETADRVTRFAADLLDSAAAEGARQSRSAKQQLDHWARVGRAVSSQHTAARRRVEAALAGELAAGRTQRGGRRGVQRRDLRGDRGKPGRRRLRPVLARRGITTVALNEDGEIVEHRPDGSSVVVTAR